MHSVPGNPTNTMPSILIVEDDPDTANILQHDLRAAGYLTTHASTFMQGLIHIREATPDLILLDLNLPDGNGSDFLARLKGTDVRIVILTGHDNVHAKIELLNLGASDYIVKPYHQTELLVRIAVQLRVPHFDIVTVRDLRLHSKTRIVTYRGQELHFSPKEFDILEFFMRHPGRIYTRTLIFQAVWDTDEMPASNVVETYMTGIRRKLRAVGIYGFLRTVDSYGYSLHL